MLSIKRAYQHDIIFSGWTIKNAAVRCALRYSERQRSERRPIVHTPVGFGFRDRHRTMSAGRANAESNNFFNVMHVEALEAIGRP
jgi:hypothetical protein